MKKQILASAIVGAVAGLAIGARPRRVVIRLSLGKQLLVFRASIFRHNHWLAADASRMSSPGPYINELVVWLARSLLLRFIWGQRASYIWPGISLEIERK